MAKIDLRNPGRPLNVGVILMAGSVCKQYVMKFPLIIHSVTEVLDIAPIDLLYGLNAEFVKNFPWYDEFADQTVETKFHWINERGTSAHLTSDITIQTTDSFSTCPPLDIVLMGAHWAGQPNEAELAFVRKAYDECSAYISICGGMMVPLAAGVLAGKTCTGPTPMLGMLKQSHPEVHWVEKRYVRDSDGKTWTSGTLLNGLDLMRAFVEETWGGEGSLAEKVIGIGHWPRRSVDYKEGE